jgi:hypothetical protein
MYEADKLSRCVQWARRRYFTSEFTFFGSINFTEDMTATEMKALWSKVCRYLSNKGVVALYTCEVSRRSNHFNYHILLRSQTTNLTELLKFATDKVKTNIKVEPYDPGRGRLAVRYMTKAKTPKYKNGEIVSRDRWARKRVLLRQELKVRKYGTIGRFWPVGMNKEGIWKEIVAHERKISDGLQQPGAEEYALELHELIGGYFPLNRVRRSVGLFGVPAGWVPKLDDDLVVDDDHDHHGDEADADEPPAPSPGEPSQEAVKPLRMAVEAPNVVGVGGSRLERPAAFYGPLLTITTITPTPTARPPPRRVDLEGRRLNLPLHLPFRPFKTQGITAGSQVQRLVRRLGPHPPARPAPAETTSNPGDGGSPSASRTMPSASFCSAAVMLSRMLRTLSPYSRAASCGASAGKSGPSVPKYRKWSNSTSGPLLPATYRLCGPMPTQLTCRSMPLDTASGPMPPTPTTALYSRSRTMPMQSNAPKQPSASGSPLCVRL